MSSLSLTSDRRPPPPRPPPRAPPPPRPTLRLMPRAPPAWERCPTLVGRALWWLAARCFVPAVCLERAACFDPVCLERACSEPACLEPACLAPALEPACLEPPCFDPACLAPACLEPAASLRLDLTPSFPLTSCCRPASAFPRKVSRASDAR